ncbi:MAG: hypothetical protein V1820_06630 [archaeon]
MEERGFFSFSGKTAGISLIALVLTIVLASPAFSATLSCSTTCTAELSCECTVTPCDSGTLVLTNSTGAPVGAFSILNGRASFYSPQKETYNIQARCGDTLSNVFQVNIGDKLPECSCTGYSNLGCGMSSCAQNQMLQKRTCTPSGCLQEAACVYSAACGDPTQSTTTTTIINGTNQACGNRVCDSGENYLNCCVDCRGCERSACSSSSRLCIETYDLVIDVPGTIYRGSQFLLSPRAVINRAQNKPVDAYTLCWQAYCQGSIVDSLGCNKNVFTIKPDVSCVDTLSALLSVENKLYQYDYSVNYLKQLKASIALFPSEYILKTGDIQGTFSLSITNLDTASTEFTVKSLSEGVRIDGTETRKISIGAGATDKVSVTTPAVAGTYQISIAEFSTAGEVQIQKLIVSTSSGQTSGAHPRISLSRNSPFSIEPGGYAEFVATVKNTGSSSGAFSIYSKGSAAGAVSFASDTQFTLASAEERSVPVKIAPTFSTEGEYGLSLCASIDSGEESCVPANIRISRSSGGLFDFSFSTERVELGVQADSPVSVDFSVISRSTLTRSVKPLVENSCPSGVITGTSFLNASSISLAESGSYSNSFKVNSLGKTVSCTFSVTLSDSSGSLTKSLEVSITPSAGDVTTVADIASRAQTKVSQAEAEVKRIANSGKDAGPAEVAVNDAKTALAACMAELNKRNYDSANVLCKKALESAEGAFAVARYTEEAYGIEPPTTGLNTYVVAGVVVVLVGAAILTFGRMF